MLKALWSVPCLLSETEMLTFPLVLTDSSSVLALAENTQLEVPQRMLSKISVHAADPMWRSSENSEDPSISKKSQQRLFVLATNSMIDLGFVLGTRWLVGHVLYATTDALAS